MQLKQQLGIPNQKQKAPVQEQLRPEAPVQEQLRLEAPPKYSVLAKHNIKTKADFREWVLKHNHDQGDKHPDFVDVLKESKDSGLRFF
jgi:hypothetical protein